jgi:ATP adenylyltransferase
MQPSTASRSRRGRQAARGAARGVLHAPWRIEYVRCPPTRGCFFCQAARLPDGDEQAWKRGLLLHRDRHLVVIFNRYPYTGGHLMVAPRRHTAELGGLRKAENAALWECIRRCVGVLESAFQPHGFNVGLNLGRAAGAGVDSHLHFHIVPRWVGDTNFMPVIGATTAVPVALESLWDQLRPAFRRGRRRS